MTVFCVIERGVDEEDATLLLPASCYHDDALRRRRLPPPPSIRACIDRCLVPGPTSFFLRHFLNNSGLHHQMDKNPSCETNVRQHHRKDRKKWQKMKLPLKDIFMSLWWHSHWWLRGSRFSRSTLIALRILKIHFGFRLLSQDLQWESHHFYYPCKLVKFNSQNMCSRYRDFKQTKFADSRNSFNVSKR
jgi:hypothetical protein